MPKEPTNKVELMENNKFYGILVQIRNLMLLNKEVLNIDEVSLYTGYEKSYLYKLTSEAKIPHFKPGGKSIFFKREEINEWLTRNPIRTRYQIEDEANQILNNNKTRKNGKFK